MPRKPSAPNAAKSAVKKAPSKPREVKDSDLKKQLLFLWTCYKVSDVHIDIPAVAKHYNIRNNTAQMRLTRLKKKLEAMEDSANSENKTNDPKVMDEDPDNDDVLIKDEDLEEDYDVTQIEEQTYDDTELEEQAEVKSESE